MAVLVHLLPLHDNVRHVHGLQETRGGPHPSTLVALCTRDDKVNSHIWYTLDFHMTITPPYPIEGGFFTMIFWNFIKFAI
jgi:hypothetical protein